MKARKIIIKHLVSMCTIIMLLVACVFISNSYGASNDTKIKKIEVTPCIDSIQQDSENSSIYRVSVNNSVNSVDVNVVPNDSNAKVDIRGNSVLDVGTNRIDITVTAQDGTSASYVIYARRLSKEIAETPITPNVQTEEKKFEKPTNNGIQPANTETAETNEIENTVEEPEKKVEENVSVHDVEKETGTWKNSEIDETTRILIIITIVITIILLFIALSGKKGKRK